MHSDMNENNVFCIEPGRWPLLSRRTFPFTIIPKQKEKDQWVFEDYGCNHALPYIFIFALSFGTVLLVEYVPGSRWGDPGFPHETKFILLAIGILLAMYSFFAALVSTDLRLSQSDAELKSRHLLMGLIPVKQTTYKFDSLTIETMPVCIAFTRTGILQSKCFGVFLCGGKEIPMKLIACCKTEDDAQSYATDTGILIGANVVESAMELRGRLSR